MRASLVVIPLVTLIAGAVCGGALGYALGARSAMERERSAIQAAIEKERASFKERAASAVPPQVRTLLDNRQQGDTTATGATGAQPATPGDSIRDRLEASRSQTAGNHQRLDPRRQRCVGGFVREFGADSQGGKIGGERDLLENGRKVECSGLLRK